MEPPPRWLLEAFACPIARLPSKESPRKLHLVPIFEGSFGLRFRRFARRLRAFPPRLVSGLDAGRERDVDARIDELLHGKSDLPEFVRTVFGPFLGQVSLVDQSLERGVIASVRHAED